MSILSLFRGRTRAAVTSRRVPDTSPRLSAIPPAPVGLFEQASDDRFGRVSVPNVARPLDRLQTRPAVTATEIESEVAARIDALVRSGAVDTHTVTAVDRFLSALLSEQLSVVEADYARALRAWRSIRAQQLANIRRTGERLDCLTKDLQAADASFDATRNRLGH